MKEISYGKTPIEVNVESHLEVFSSDPVIIITLKQRKKLLVLALKNYFQSADSMGFVGGFQGDAKARMLRNNRSGFLPHACRCPRLNWKKNLGAYKWTVLANLCHARYMHQVKALLHTENSSSRAAQHRPSLLLNHKPKPAPLQITSQTEARANTQSLALILMHVGVPLDNPG